MGKEQDKQPYEPPRRAAPEEAPGAEGEAYTLESILAEFGSGAAQPAPKAPSPAARDADGVAIRRAPPSRLAGKNPPPPVDTLSDTRRLPRVKAADKPPEEPAPRQRPKKEPPPPPVAEMPTRTDDTPPDRVFLKDLMRQTVDSAMAENEDGIIDQPVPLRERLRALRRQRRRPRRTRYVPQDTEALWEEPAEEEEPEPESPEPEPDDAHRAARRQCRHLHHFVLLAALPVLLLAALTVLDGLSALPLLWRSDALVRCTALGGGLLITALLCMDVWRAAAEQLRTRHSAGCELAVLTVTLAALANCAADALRGSAEGQPFAVCAAVSIWLCQWGLLQEAKARRDAFRLTEMGGRPPYVVGMTGAGACKQRGLLTGFYRLWDRTDPARGWQRFTVPLLLAAATILAALTAASHREPERFLWIWSAMLCAAVPMALPLHCALPLALLQRRISRSGCAVAGYAGARAVSRARRLVLTESDLFPPGTVEFNGYKVYGEERIKMLSYAAAITNAAHSQLYPLFAQQLASEGGFRTEIDDLQFYEEGGVGGTIRGETVLMGSAFFMRRRHVALPPDLKLHTGVFMAVDGVLGAIFVIKYQPSRNVEWALQALRRAHMPPVLAVRSGNVTPGLLKRKFGVDCRPIYPDVTTRLALSDAMETTGEAPNAVLYREGLMPLVETVVGARRLVKAVRRALLLSYIGGAAGLLLTYYLTSVGSYTTLTPLYMLGFCLLWLLPTLLLSSSVRHF